jgi:hypothetical protein
MSDRRHMMMCLALAAVLGSTAAADPKNDSTLTPDTVLSKIQSAYMTGVKACYKDHLKKAPGATGKLALTFAVGAKGRTLDPKATGFAPLLDACVTDKMKAWRFPIPKDAAGAPTTASFSITIQLVPD